MHFRIELELKYISSGRVFKSVDFTKVENPDVGCASEAKKVITSKILVKIDFLALEA